MAIYPSPRFAFLLLLSHFSAAVAVYAVPLTLPVKLALCFPVLASLFFHLARDAFLIHPASWCRLSLQEGMATIRTRDGAELCGRVGGDSVVTSWFVILRIKPEDRRGTFVRAIFPDAMEKDAFRELCVRLRYL